MIHTLQPNQNVVDAAVMKILPGDTVQIPDGYTTPLRFIGLTGVTVHGGSLTIPINLSYAVKFEGCKEFRFTETKVKGGHIGITCEKLSTNFELDKLSVSSVGFAAIMAKSDPQTDDAMRGNFTMRDCLIHDNYIQDTGGEGLYIGNSFYVKGVVGADGKTRFPHDLENVRIFRNKVLNTGWDGIQVGCSVKGSTIYDNVIENYGLLMKAGQNNGIQLGEGTGGLCFGNKIRKGTGNGMIVLGNSNVVFDNDIIEAGEHGIFCDKRGDSTGFQFHRNTISSPKLDGIRIYAELNNVIDGNVIFNPGAEFIKKKNDKVKVTGQNTLVR